MRAILNVDKISQYSKHNYHTFNVMEISPEVIVLDVENKPISFGLKEIIISDLDIEMYHAFKEKYMNNNENTYLSLIRYTKINQILYNTNELVKLFFNKKNVRN